MSGLRRFIPIFCLVGLAVIWGGPVFVNAIKDDVDRWGWLAPDPGPPAPKVGAWVLIIEESSERSPWVARLIADREFWQSVEDRGLRWRVYDIDSAGDSRGEITKQAREVGLPALVTIDEDKEAILSIERLPNSIDAVNESIKRATGL